MLKIFVRGAAIAVAVLFKILLLIWSGPQALVISRLFRIFSVSSSLTCKCSNNGWFMFGSIGRSGLISGSLALDANVLLKILHLDIDEVMTCPCLINGGMPFFILFPYISFINFQYCLEVVVGSVSLFDRLV